jgi:hypothetical protein
MLVVLASMALNGFKLVQVALILALYANIVALPGGVNFAFLPYKMMSILAVEVVTHLVGPRQS